MQILSSQRAGHLSWYRTLELLYSEIISFVRLLQNARIWIAGDVDKRITIATKNNGSHSDLKDFFSTMNKYPHGISCNI